MSDWNIIFILHNLSLNNPIEYNYIALVPSSDSRVQKLIKKHDKLKYFINNFTDQFGRKISPSIIVVRDDAPRNLLSSEAIIDFRNVIAISFIIIAWQDSLNKRVPLNYTKFSDYFDIYPINPSKDYKYLMSWTPSIMSADEPNEFCGQCSPGLARINSVKEYDKELFDSLLKKWEEKHLKKRQKSWKLICLFRSLEMAYHACSMPYENNSTIYDYGAKLSIWVGAFEILIHPQNGKANLKKVLDLIGKVKFNSKKLRNKYYRIPNPNNKNKKIGVNLAQKLYSQIYDARCDFLHGNPVSTKDIFPFKSQNDYTLNFFAPLIYNIALKCFLEIFNNKIDLNKLSNSQFSNYRNLEEGLLKALKDRRR